MNSRTGKYLNPLKNIFYYRYFYVHIGYWILYLLFFTVQRFSFYGYSDFIPNLKLNLAYLPSVLIFTYIVTEYVLPALFSGKNLFIPVIILSMIIVIDPVVAYLVRVYIIEPYIYNDHRVYSLYNYLTAILIFVFGAVPLAVWKIARLLRAHYIHYQNVENEKLEAELKLKESELKLLKGQIQPHFLFNTLNNLYSMALEKSEKTPGLILRLSEMLSYITYDCNAEKIQLNKEIEFIRSYIELQNLRYESCEISVKISGNMDNKKIAPMILHTFIDNSFKHGAGTDSGDPRIAISINVKDNSLLLSVVNSIRMDENYEEKIHGIGIQNARKRLEMIYPDRHELEINNSGTKYSVSLRLEL